MQYDLVIVGAGIQGAGVAQAAAAAGYRVLILEKTAIAAGTSCKSSKLIHGGLRYLESAQFSLVRESLHERALLLKLAPSLVSLKPLHIPVYKNSTRSALKIRAGLSLYSALAGFGRDTFFRALAKHEWSTLTGLNQQGLTAVFRYMEAQTDDAALTCAVMRSAQHYGAELCLPANFESATVTNEGVEVNYQDAVGQHSVRTRVLINSAGPWANQVISAITPKLQICPVDLVQGSHLLLPPLLDQYFYLEAPSDQRAIFILPWKNKLLVGTTETMHHDKPEKAVTTVDEKNYLLATLQHYFPSLVIDPAQVATFAGLRVLPKSDKKAFSRTREVLFAVDNEQVPRVLSLMGGKLTTYRATAEQVMKRLSKSLPAAKREARTDQISLEH